MRYLLLIYTDEHALSEAERQACYAESAQFAQEIHASGRYVDCSPLQPTATAASVRVRGGKPLVTDGPFAETREQLAGYFLIEAGDRDEAIGIAARVPAGRWGTVEIRPLIEMAGLPGEPAQPRPAAKPRSVSSSPARGAARSVGRSEG